MDNQFSPLEIKLLKTLVGRISDDDIAATLNKPVALVQTYVHDITGGENPFHLKAAVAEEKAIVVEKKKVARRTESEKQKKKKELQQLIQKQAQERYQKRREQERPKFTTKAVDYSQMRAVRIDHRTIIYARPGEDIETVRQNYLNKHKATK